MRHDVRMIAEEFPYAPHDTPCPPPKTDVCGRFLCTLLAGKDFVVGWMCRWWSMTTDPEFLTSGVSRRDMWKVLLPMPGLLAMCVDTGASSLVILDASSAFALLVAAWLPAGLLWSDLVIGAIHAAHVAAHGFIGTGLELSYLTYQVLAIAAMSAAGIHTVALAGFMIISVAAAPFLDSTWKPEQVLVCIYVLGLGSFTECRVAQLYCEWQTHHMGYKALNLTSSNQDGYLGFTTAKSSQIDPLVEDAPESASRSSLANYVLSRLSPHDMSLRSSMADYVFSRLLPVHPVSQTRPKQRFAASQVQVPGAATHEPPLFSDKVDQYGCIPALAQAPPHPEPVQQKPKPGLEFQHVETTRSTQPLGTPPSSECPSVLRGVKLTGFHCIELNVLFVENPEPAFVVNGRETYWSSVSDYFLYHSSTTNTWGAAKVKWFQQVQSGQNNSVARSPKGYEIWNVSAMPAKKNWIEWDADVGKWETRPGSGVESRGKVRPKTAPMDVAVQTDWQFEEKATQTECLPDI